MKGLPQTGSGAEAPRLMGSKSISTIEGEVP
jgi:hypothetical protein